MQPAHEQPVPSGADPWSDLVCPITLRPLVHVGDRLLCYASRKAYRIEDGIPVLLAEEAQDIPESELPEEYRGTPPVTSREK